MTDPTNQLDTAEKANLVAAAYLELADYWQGHKPGGDLDGQFHKLEETVKAYGEMPIEVPGPEGARTVAEAYEDLAKVYVTYRDDKFPDHLLANERGVINDLRQDWNDSAYEDQHAPEPSHREETDIDPRVDDFAEDAREHNQAYGSQLASRADQAADLLEEYASWQDKLGTDTAPQGLDKLVSWQLATDCKNIGFDPVQPVNSAEAREAVQAFRDMAGAARDYAQDPTPSNGHKLQEHELQVSKFSETPELNIGSGKDELGHDHRRDGPEIC